MYAPLAGPRCVAVSQSKVQIDDWLRAPSRRPSSRCSVEPVTVSWRGSSDNAGLCSRAVRNPRGSRVRRRGTGPRGAGHAGGGDLSRRARAALDDDAANACVHPRLTFRRSCSACEERAPPGTKTRAQAEALAPLVRSCDQLCELNVLELSQVGSQTPRWGVGCAVQELRRDDRARR